MRAFLGPPRGEWRGERGTLAIWTPAPGVLVTRAEGHFHAALAEHVVTLGNEVVREHHTLVGFHDWGEVATYDSETRARLTDWGYGIRKEVERVHVLVGSRLVRMGLSVASIVLVGMLKPYDDREAFETALRAVLAERRRRGRTPTIPP